MPKQTLERSGEKLAESAEKIKRSTHGVEDSAARTTELAADRTVFAAERTYAAWVRTGLMALASGIGAKALLSGVIPHWLIIATGTVLVLFSAFCFGAAVWRHLEPSPASRCITHPGMAFDRREWISCTCGTCRACRHMVRPDPWRTVNNITAAG